MSDDIVVRIRAEGVDEFTKELKKTGAIVEDVGEQAEKTEKRVSSSAKKMGVALGAAFTTAAIIQFTKELGKLAIELDATNAKFKTVFGEASKELDKFAKNNANRLGLTTAEFKKAASAAGDLLIPLKFTRQQAADLSKDLIALSGALSAWTGGQQSAAEVSDILNKALLGEREQLKTLGISIKEADVSARLLEKGQKKLTGTALEQAKALATLELITEKTTDAQNAFTDDTITLAEAQLQFKVGIGELRDSLAESLIPALTNLLTFLNKGVKAYNRFNRAVSGQETLNAINQANEALSTRALIIQRGIEVAKLQEIESKKDNILKTRDLKLQREVIAGIDDELELRKELTDQVIENEEELDKFVNTLTKAKNKAAELSRVLENNTITSLRDLLDATNKANEEAAQLQSDLLGDNEVIISRSTQNIIDIRNRDIENEKKNAEESKRLAEEQAQLQEKLARERLQQEQAKQQGIISIAQTTSQLFGTLAGDNAKAQKANAVFEIGLNTSIAITKALTRGPIIGPILAAVVSGLALAQLSQVLSTPVPQFATGTKGSKTAPEGFAWVGEQGPELVQMKGGEKVITNKDSEQLMKMLGGYGIPVQFKTTYEEMYKPMSAMRALAEGTPLEGIDWNPLLRSNDVGRRSSGRKLDKIYEEMVRLNHGLTRRMTRA